MFPIDLSILSQISIPIVIVVAAELLFRREEAADLFKTLLVLLVPFSVIPMMYSLGYF